MTYAHRALTGLVVVSVALSGLLLALAMRPAVADVTEVTGSAYGFFSDVSLFGGPSSERGPEPTVELAEDASNSPQEASVDEAAAVYGPAEVFRSGQIDVRVEGTLGAGGSVTSSSRVQGAPDPEQRPGPLLYDELESTCVADEDGVTATTTVTGGVVETSYDPDTQLPETTEDVPEEPEPGHTVEGTIDHVGDRFRIVYNEQIENPDGSVTVNAAHMYLLGDIAVGDLIIGQSTCGVEGTGTTDATDDADTEETEDTDSSEKVATSPTAADEDGGVPIAALLVGALVLLAIIAGVLLARRRGTAGEA